LPKSAKTASRAFEVVKPYLEHHRINHREKSVALATGRLEHVKRLLGPVLLPDLKEDSIRGYIKTRLKEKASGRTINMEVGELSCGIGKAAVVRPVAEGAETGRGEGCGQGPFVRKKKPGF
jgi:hypothetical protein